MTSRRKNLLLLLPLYVAYFFIGMIGPVEFTIWLVLAAAWIVALAVWGSPRRSPES